MPPVLRSKLADARRKWRLVTAASVLLLSASCLILLALISFYSDRLLVLETSGRLSWLIALSATLCAGALLALIIPLSRRLPDPVVAQQVERRFPALGERLLSAVELADYGSGPGVSEQMVAALSRDAEAAAANLDFRRAITYGPARKPTVLASFAGLLLAGHLIMAPASLQVWLRRILNPSADIPLYARTIVTASAERDIIARGEDIRLSVLLTGGLQDQATLRYRFADGAWNQVGLRSPHAVRAENGEARRFEFTLPDAQQSVTFYASAGDGRSNPRTVQVEDRPAILGVQLRLDFPDYTGKPSQTVTATSGNIIAPVGTRVEVAATASKELKEATFLRGGKPKGAWRVRGPVASGELTVSKDETYGLRIRDLHGFEAEETPQYTIRAQADRTPEVQIVRPGMDLDRAPNGSIRLELNATDDYGIKSTRLVYESARKKGSLELPGADGSPRVMTSARWNLGSLGLKAGDSVVYHATARDGDTVSGPHTGRSPEYRINILSYAEMRERLESEQAQEREALKQLLERQKESQKLLERARKAPADTERLNQAQAAQQSVAQETAELARRMQRTSSEMEDNQVGTARQLQEREQTRQSLDSLTRREMREAADSLQRAQQNAQSRPAEMSRAARQEQQAREELERLAMEQQPGPGISELAEMADRLSQEQQRLADESDVMNARMDNRAASELTPAERARMEQLAKRQAQLREQTKALEQQVQKAARDAAQNGRPESADLQSAARMAQESGTQQKQSGAEQSLRASQPQQASPQQSSAARDLENLARQLDEAVLKSDNQNLEQRADRLDKLADRLLDMANEQRRIWNETQNYPNAERSRQLAQREQELARESREIGRQIQRDAPSAARNLEKAERSLGQAQQELNRPSPQTATAPARQAAADLLQAVRDAREAARSMQEQQAAMEMQQKLQEMARQQRDVQRQTRQLEKERKNGSLSADQQKRAEQISRAQQDLARQGQEMNREMPSQGFRWAMQQANRRMENASRGLEQRNTGADTQRNQENAAQMMERIARSLEQQARGAQQQRQAQDSQSGAQGGQAEAAGELQLAREMEAQIRQETSSLDQRRSRNPGRRMTAEQERELNALSQAQREARRIAERAASQFRANAEIGKSVQKALERLDEAQDQLEMQETGEPTQRPQQQAVSSLDTAIQQARQAMREQRQQMAQQQQQQGQQQAGNMQGQQQQPGGNQPAQRSLAPLSGVQHGKLRDADMRGRGFGGLSQRAIQSLREGRQEKVPAEYRELVNQYYKALSERSNR